MRVQTGGVTVVCQPRPGRGLSLAAERALARSEGSASHTIGDLPIPGDSLSLEDVRNAAIIDRSMDSLNWSGEISDRLPIPR